MSPAAWTVLSHHAVQADLTPLQQAVMCVPSADPLPITVTAPPQCNPFTDVYQLQINNNNINETLYCVFVCVCSRWHCYSSHHRSQRMCYALLLRLLRAVEAEWEAGDVNKELVGPLFLRTSSNRNGRE